MIRLTNETIADIKAKHAAGWTAYKIASVVGLDYKLVKAVCDGRRGGDHGRKSQSDDGLPKPRAGDKRNYHCTNCGAMVVFPCYACAIRARKRAEKIAGVKPRQYVGLLNSPVVDLTEDERITNALEASGYLLVGDLQGVTALPLGPIESARVVRGLARIVVREEIRQLEERRKMAPKHAQGLLLSRIHDREIKLAKMPKP